MTLSKPGRARYLAISAGLIGLLCAGAAHGAKLRVNISGIRHAAGAVRVAVCSKAHFLTRKCAYDQSVPARKGRVTVMFDNIPAGIYAVQAYDDANGNHKLDRNWLGWPKEGLGFSNNAPMHHGPPDYTAAAIRLHNPGGAIAFSMRYY